MPVQFGGLRCLVGPLPDIERRYYELKYSGELQNPRLVVTERAKDDTQASRMSIVDGQNDVLSFINVHTNGQLDPFESFKEEATRWLTETPPPMPSGGTLDFAPSFQDNLLTHMGLANGKLLQLQENYFKAFFDHYHAQTEDMDGNPIIFEDLSVGTPAEGKPLPANPKLVLEIRDWSGESKFHVLPSLPHLFGPEPEQAPQKPSGNLFARLFKALSGT